MDKVKLLEEVLVMAIDKISDLPKNEKVKVQSDYDEIYHSNKTFMQFFDWAADALGLDFDYEEIPDSLRDTVVKDGDFDILETIYYSCQITTGETHHHLETSEYERLAKYNKIFKQKTTKGEETMENKVGLVEEIEVEKKSVKEVVEEIVSRKEVKIAVVTALSAGVLYGYKKALHPHIAPVIESLKEETLRQAEELKEKIVQGAADFLEVVKSAEDSEE